jgi:hypothetical protein
VIYIYIYADYNSAKLVYCINVLEALLNYQHVAFTQFSYKDLSGISKVVSKVDRLCGLVVRVPGNRSRGPGLIPRATRFDDK